MCDWRPNPDIQSFPRPRPAVIHLTQFEAVRSDSLSADRRCARSRNAKYLNAMLSRGQARQVHRHSRQQGTGLCKRTHSLPMRQPGQSKKPERWPVRACWVQTRQLDWQLDDALLTAALRGQLPHISDQADHIRIGQALVVFTGHQAQRPAIAAHTVRNAAHPVHRLIGGHAWISRGEIGPGQFETLAVVGQGGPTGAAETQG